ncbi:hypothetical protein SASPL_150201 [Salvia splendens]|uniref:Leucine-rich repeat-containing N-terminal plant-type domain-containing protein n=1 Tax=Salvia splendens TaxID=180675 RepID=A0A8X8Z1J2_SALSN|nr:hypothetical protein SASPL_150201 [Salvia splendens]
MYSQRTRRYPPHSQSRPRTPLYTSGPSSYFSPDMYGPQPFSCSDWEQPGVLSDYYEPPHERSNSSRAGTVTPTAALLSPKPELGLVFTRIAPAIVSACEKPDMLGSALPNVRSPCWKDLRSPVARTSATTDSPKPVVPAAPKPEPAPHVPKLSFAFSLNFDTDKNALISFKNSITSDTNAILSINWSQNTSVCNWIGVSCGLKHGRVTALNLPRYDLAGTVAPHLGNLSFLRYLDISSNSFVGMLSFELSKLRRLKVMNLGANSFTGEIPTWLGSLPQLEELYLYNNSFLGKIPSSLFNNSKLQMLQILHLYSNKLSGSIPHVIFNVSSLREIRIGINSLSGRLPIDMCNNMPNIKFLALSWNQLEGQIPSNIWKCTHLDVLSLSFNNFSGSIPRETGRLSMLTKLHLGYNSGFQGGVPPEIGNLSRLEILGIGNASLTGIIPSSIFNMSYLEKLYLGDNKLTDLK